MCPICLLKIIILWETPDTGCTFFLRPNPLFRARAGHSRDFGAASGDLESVTESKAEPIEDIRRIIERWGEKLVPHQDPSGQVSHHLLKVAIADAVLAIPTGALQDDFARKVTPLEL
jgi:hypothetical protein